MEQLFGDSNLMLIIGGVVADIFSSVVSNKKIPYKGVILPLLVVILRAITDRAEELINYGGDE